MTSLKWPAGDRRAALLVGLLAWVAVLAASPSAFPRSSDGRAMFATAESLARRGDLAIDDLFLDDHIPINPSARRGVDGRAHSKYGVGWPLLLAAMLTLTTALGLPAAGTGAHAALLAFNPLLTALTAAVAFRIARLLGASTGGAILLGLGSVLTTFAWPTGVSDGADPLMALLVTLTMWLVLRYDAGGLWHEAAGAGLAAGAAILTKPVLIVLAPGVLVATAVAAGAPPRRARAILACAAGIGAALAAQLWLNHLQWGSPFASGYNEPVFTGDLPGNLARLTIGINKGLLWHAPIAALGLVAVGLRARQQPAWACAAGGGALAVLAVNAGFYDFGGGWTWGPRYLLPVIPPLAASAAPLLAGRAGRAIVVTALGLGALVTVAGTLVDASASRATFAPAWLPEATGTMVSGDTLRPGVLVEQPRPVEDVLPEFSGLAVHVWLLRVLAEPCACSAASSSCLCADGRDMYWNDRFRRPPWRTRYPGVDPRPPYGQDLLAPALLRTLYKLAVFDASTVAPTAGNRLAP